MKTPALLACLAAACLAGGPASADILIAGGWMTNSGSYPFKAAETVGAFIERIGGIKPEVYEGSEKPRPYPTDELRILRDGHWGDTYRIYRDATRLWNHELKDGDMIQLPAYDVGEKVKKWQGEYRDEWTIRIPKAPAETETKVLSWSEMNGESGHRKMLMEAFPGLEFGFYHFSGRLSIGVLEDFDHDRVLVVDTGWIGKATITRNGVELKPPFGESGKVRIAGKVHMLDGRVMDDPDRSSDWPVGFWLPMEATDTMSITLALEHPDRGRIQADYDPDTGWRTTSDLKDAKSPAEDAPPADAYELTRKSLLARVLQVLEEKPECVVRKRHWPDIKIARLPEDFLEEDSIPLLVRLADRILVGVGDYEVDPFQLERHFEMYAQAAMGAGTAPQVVVHIGKYATDARFREFLAAIRRVDIRPVYLVKDPYDAWLGCWPSEKKALKQLEALAVPEIDLPKQAFTAALESLQQRYAKGKAGGVINFIVKDSATSQPAAPGSVPADKTVSLQAKNLSFAAAIDALCVQAGCEWWLEAYDEEVPLLVIRPRSLPEEFAKVRAAGKEPDLVFVGTVESIKTASQSQWLANWVVTFRVDRIKSGEFAGKTFAFRIHSPSRSGLKEGGQYEVKARRTATGYAVDPAQWQPGGEVAPAGQ
jgi:hypothetical protein